MKKFLTDLFISIQISIIAFVIFSYFASVFNFGNDITDFIATYGTVELISVIMIFIYLRIWRQTKKLIWHIAMIGFLFAVAGIAYFMVRTGGY